jgi:hypothetical protein
MHRVNGASQQVHLQQHQQGMFQILHMAINNQLNLAMAVGTNS